MMNRSKLLAAICTVGLMLSTLSGAAVASPVIDQAGVDAAVAAMIANYKAPAIATDGFSKTSAFLPASSKPKPDCVVGSGTVASSPPPVSGTNAQGKPTCTMTCKMNMSNGTVATSPKPGATETGQTCAQLGASGEASFCEGVCVGWNIAKNLAK